VIGLDMPIDVHGLGTVAADIAFGGQFYVQAPAASFGVELGAANAPSIVRAAMSLLAAAREQVTVRHPEYPAIDHIALVMLHGPSQETGIDGRNSVVMPNGRVDAKDPSTWWGSLDRSPCGTGTSARMACLYARGAVAVGPAIRAPGSARDDLHRHAAFAHDGGKSAGGRAFCGGTRVDHGPQLPHAGSGRSLPAGLHGGRHLGLLELLTRPFTKPEAWGWNSHISPVLTGASRHRSKWRHPAFPLARGIGPCVAGVGFEPSLEDPSNISV